MADKKKEEKKETSFFIYENDKCKKMFSGAKLLSSANKEEGLVEDAPDEPGPTVLKLEHLKNLQVSDSKQCSYCRLSFESTEEQRSHYKLDWHRYNLKLSLESRPPVSEAEFCRLIEDLDKNEDDNLSISGSDSEDEEEEENYQEFQRNPKFYFKTESNKILSVYKTLLVDPKLKTIPNDQTLLKSIENSNYTWAIFMLGGGHFAGAIFQGAEVLVHKTFHCYTVRAKQGGSQGAADNRAGSTHKSAGASLRRYNEMSLIQHVQDITKLWSDRLQASHLIFYRAASGNRSVLFGGKSPALSRTDPRLRTIPFPTKRATFSEVKRVQQMLARIEILDEIQGLGINKTNKKSNPARIHRSKSREPKDRDIPSLGTEQEDSEDEVDAELSFSQEVHSTRELVEFEHTPARNKNKKRKNKKAGIDADQTNINDDSENESTRLNIELQNRLLTAVRTGNVKEINSCVDRLLDEQESSSQEDRKPLKNQNESQEDENAVLGKSADKGFEDMMNKQYGEGKLTFLHMAAQGGHRQVVMRLLELGADPSIKDKLKRVPYALATDKETRNAFRKAQGLFPTRYDWKTAQVPAPLSQEEQEIKDKKMNEKKKAKRLEKKEKEKAQKQEERLKKEEEKERERFLALSDREKRALAAERRLLASSGASVVLSRCFLCAADITGKVPFTYFENNFCSTGCVKKHRESSK